MMNRSTKIMKISVTKKGKREREREREGIEGFAGILRVYVNQAKVGCNSICAPTTPQKSCYANCTQLYLLYN